MPETKSTFPTKAHASSCSQEAIVVCGRRYGLAHPDSIYNPLSFARLYNKI